MNADYQQISDKKDRINMEKNMEKYRKKQEFCRKICIFRLFFVTLQRFRTVILLC